MLFNRAKHLVRRAYNAILHSESHYLFDVLQQRRAQGARELEEDPLLITPYGWSGYSQNDDDGIVQEIFRRVGVTTKRFLEFGAGDCLENIGTYLLLSGWRGKWLEASEGQVNDIRKQFALYLNTGELAVQHVFVTLDNINDLVDGRDLDLLIIDIDGNDYYVWNALETRPRVVIIEYNATFRPPVALVQEYSPEPFWRGENFCGASLSALESLGRKKKYCLVGCNYVGTNAYFVRDDLTDGKFSAPYTAEHHYREQLIDALHWGGLRQIRSVGNGRRRYRVLDS